MAIDAAIVLLLVFFIWRGAARGFLQSLIGPLAFIVATAGAVFYYHSTKNIWISLGIGLAGPFLLHFALAFILRSFGFLSGGPGKPSFLSGLLGALITALWGMSLVLPVIVLLGFLPGTGPYTKGSLICAAAKPLTKFIIPPVSGAKTASPSPAAPTSSAANPLQAIAGDPRMQALLKDPAIVKAVEEKNYPALLSNPKILEIAQDPAFVQKLLAAWAQTQKTRQ